MKYSEETFKFIKEGLEDAIKKNFYIKTEILSLYGTYSNITNAYSECIYTYNADSNEKTPDLDLRLLIENNEKKYLYNNGCNIPLSWTSTDAVDTASGVFKELFIILKNINDPKWIMDNIEEKEKYIFVKYYINYKEIYNISDEWINDNKHYIRSNASNLWDFKK
jgi:hypothetical protein